MNENLKTTIANLKITVTNSNTLDDKAKQSLLQFLELCEYYYQLGYKDGIKI